jgi:hypothetical protein
MAMHYEDFKLQQVYWLVDTALSMVTSENWQNAIDIIIEELVCWS